MPAKKRSKQKKRSNSKKTTQNKFGVLAAILIIIGLGFLIPSVKHVLPTSTVAQRFPGDPNPLVSGKAFFGSSGDFIAQHEAAAGKSVSLYRKFYQWNTASSAASAITSNYNANRMMWISFKTPKWSDVANGTYDSTLDSMLRTIDATGHPVWVTFWHEPENDEGASNAGSAADYVNMQKRVRARMTAVGTKNIAFAPVYQSSKIVSMGATHNNWYAAGVWDFLGFDIYMQNDTQSILGSNWTTTINWITSKGQPYAMGEWGVRTTAPSSQITDFWNWAFTNHKDNVGMSYFDSDANSVGSWVLAGANNTVWNNILKTDTRVMRVQELGSSTSGGGGGGTTPPPAADTTKPTVSVTAPGNGNTVAGTITISGNASDNVAMKSVTLRVDNTYLQTDTTSPYSFSLDTTKYADGAHTVTLRAYDSSDNVGEASVSVAVHNAADTGSGGTDTGGGTGGGTSGGGTTVVTPTTPTTAADPVAVTGTVVVKPTTPGSEVSVKVDDEAVNGTAVDTTDLTNGTHKLTITENGKKNDVYINVKNPLPKAMLNEFKAHPVAYTSGSIFVFGGLFALFYFFRRPIYLAITHFRDRNKVMFGPGNQLIKRFKK